MKESLMENFIFCAVSGVSVIQQILHRMEYIMENTVLSSSFSL